MNAPLEPRTKLDFLYKEVLGEVGNLISRLEQVTATVSLCMEDARKLPMDTRQAVAQTNRRLNEETMREFGRLSDRLDRLVLAAEEHARTIRASTRRLVLVVGVLGTLAGGAAGILAAIAMASHLTGS